MARQENSDLLLNPISELGLERRCRCEIDYIESFNGVLNGEVLNLDIFDTLCKV